MEADRGKLFVGGIERETTIEQLREYFERYGEVSIASIVNDKVTRRPRGFGFVTFSDASVIDRVLKIKHVIGNRTVEVKQALLREEYNSSARKANGNGSVVRFPGPGGGYFRTKKIFVGGLPATLTENDFREYFRTYGLLTDVVIIYDRNTRRPRGFGFISFDSEDSVDRVLTKTFHELNGKPVEVKRAQPKYSNSGGGRSSDVYSGVAEFYGPPVADQNMNRKFPLPQNTFHNFHPTYGYGVPYYSFNDFTGYGIGNYVFPTSMVTHQPYIPVGYGTTSYEDGPVMTSRFANIVSHGLQGYIHGSYITNDGSLFNELIDSRARAKSEANNN